jgi:hypothetical protein
VGGSFDFERAWQGKLRTALAQTAGEATRHLILEGGGQLSDQSARGEVVQWTSQMLARAEAALDEGELAQVFTGCACHYPAEELIPLREAFAHAGDLYAILAQLQERFEHFLTSIIKLPRECLDEVVSRGWGLAGRLVGDTIIATKIPTSGYLLEYLQELDRDRRRALYCHCPRVRSAVADGQQLSKTYCYCGAGYYQNLWETILDQPVKVEVVSSVLSGDDTCTVAIHLPPGIYAAM